MTNRAFSLKSTMDRQKKLKVLLRNSTRNTLTEQQLNKIANYVQLGQQYSIEVHTDPDSFRKALVLVQTTMRMDRGKIIFGQALFGISNEDGSEDGQLLTEFRSAAAHIVQFEDAHAEYHALHIYIPKRIYQRGKDAQHEERRQAENRA